MRRAPLLIAAGLLLAAACASGDDDGASSIPSTSAPITTPDPTVSEPAATASPTTVPAATAGGATYEDFAPLPQDRNWLQVVAGGEIVVEETPELCVVIGGEDNRIGQIRATHFELDWTGDDWIVRFRRADGDHTGAVTGSIDGLEVTFEGTVDDLAVEGGAYCFEP